MARVFATCGGRRFIQLGSSAEYGPANGSCVERVTPDRPKSRYGQAKLAAFEAVEAAANDRFEAVEARIFFVYGPGENPARFVPLLCRAHLAGKVPSIGSGRQVRDLLHADDAAGALLAVAASAGLCGIINIGSGTPVTLAEVARLIAGVAGADSTGLGARGDRKDEPLLLVPAVERLRSTGWSPAIELEEGLSRTFAWWRAVAEGRALR
jgi:nucleoside-diphosphate-sugar epimerase